VAAEARQVKLGMLFVLSGFRSRFMETTFLNGAVRKLELPTINGRPGPDAPRLKRLLLPQGELAHFYDGEEGIKYLAAVQLMPGTVRGNHYHERKKEGLYILSGEVEIIVEDVQSRQRAEFNLQAGSLAVFSVRIAHAFRTVREGLGLEFSPARFDASDSQAYPLV
jgi:mannose-6-phosphate isomerase-like protein (cupin superfamily)